MITHPRRWSYAQPARLAGIFLLLMWIGPVTFDQTGAWQFLRWFGAPEPASAESRTIPAGRAMLLETGTILKLRLRDGSTIEGRFLGRTLLDSVFYAPRFESYAHSSAHVPLVLGETLRVWLRDGREMTAPFAGYAELTLLLRSPDGPEYIRVPFEFASEIRRANGDRVEPKALTKSFRDGSLPSAEALMLGERVPMAIVSDEWAWASTLRVPVEDIESVRVDLSSGEGGSSGGSAPAGAIVLGVMVTLGIILILAANSADHSSSSCEPNTPAFWPSGFLSTHLTRRPFDRSRGCFEGDPLAVADPWPGSVDDPTLALADSAHEDSSCGLRNVERAAAIDSPFGVMRARGHEEEP